MVKKRISVSIETSLIKELDAITTNRSAFLQALLEGALAGWKTIMVPSGYQIAHAISGPPPPPPPPGASEEEEREWKEAYEARMAERKKRFALTPEQIAFKGAQEGITNQLNELFTQHKITADMASSDIKAMRKEMFKMLKAQEENSKEQTREGE